MSPDTLNIVLPTEINSVFFSVKEGNIFVQSTNIPYFTKRQYYAS